MPKRVPKGVWTVRSCQSWSSTLRRQDRSVGRAKLIWAYFPASTNSRRRWGWLPFPWRTIPNYGFLSWNGPARTSHGKYQTYASGQVSFRTSWENQWSCSRSSRLLSGVSSNFLPYLLFSHKSKNSKILLVVATSEENRFWTYFTDKMDIYIYTHTQL